MIQRAEIDRAVGRRLEQLRTNAHLTQKKVASVLTQDAQTYRKIEDGRRSAKLREVAALAAHYNVDVRWILCGLSAKERKMIDVMREP